MAKQRKHSDDFKEFWESVDRWRNKLEQNSAEPLTRPDGVNVQHARDGAPGNESLNRLENAWAQCCEFGEWPWLKARTAAPKVSRSPLGVLFGYVDLGLYPPPEVILALAEKFEKYMDAEGAMALEDAFFGKPVQAAGNFAKRSATRRRNFDIAMRVALENRDGKKDQDAAETVAYDLESQGVCLDPDTVLKIANHEMPRVSRKR